MAESPAPAETIMERRQEYMVSPNGDGEPTLRTAIFLKPSVTSINGPEFELPLHSISSTIPTSNHGKSPLKVKFHGWRKPPSNWKKWVDRLHSRHQSTWKEAGIYESVMGSTYTIQRNDLLVFGFAEKWCSETNTFIFPWGESSVTLEDMMILAGYSVLGSSVLSPLESFQLKEIEDKLIESRSTIVGSKAKKATQQPWMKQFMGNEEEDERELEHEAFLSLWLSRFVFPNTTDCIRKHVFPIAIHLSRGTRIALAPAVLASIYRDMSVLKQAIFASTSTTVELEKDGNNTHGCGHDVLKLKLSAPLYFVLIWAWERFITLRPKPNSLDYNEPRMARWDKSKKVKVGNVRLVLDSARDCFQWRPYTLNVNNCSFPKFYRDREEWVMVDSDLDVEFESFVQCLRASELVGIDCIEQYLPHRVAMQFGLDQDLPGHVGRCNENPNIAWKNYSKPISNEKVYIPSRLFESDITARYSKWWKESVSGVKDSMKKGDDVWQRRSSKRPEKQQESVEKEKGTNDAAVPPGFCRKWNDSVQAVGSSDERPNSKRLKKGLKVEERENHVPDPPHYFHPKCSNVFEVLDSDEEDELTIGQFLNLRKNNSVARSGDVGKCTSDADQFKSLSSSTTDNAVVIRKKEPWMEGREKITPGEAAAGGSKKYVDLEDACNENDTRSDGAANNYAVNRNNMEGEGESIGYDQLQARISSLEKVFAGLKRKHCCKFGMNSATRGPSIL